MASSGSFSTNYCTPVSKTWYWDLSWWVESWSGNTATIYYEVCSRCTSGTSGSQYIENYGFSGSIAGNSFSSSNRFYKDVVIYSGRFTLSGGTYFEASVTAHPYSGSNTSSGSGGWTLDNNVITPTVTVSVGSRTETSIDVSMSVTHEGYQPIQDRYIDVFSDSGCTNKVGGISSSSGTVTGLSANRTYYVRANASNGYYRGYSGVASTSTYQYPYVSGVNTGNLIIGNQQTVSLYNPLGRNVTVYMKKDNTSGTTLYSGTTTGTSKSFTPTASTLYNSIPSSSSGNCVYYCVYSGQNVNTISGKTYSVSGGNAQAPNFSDFDYKDTDSLGAQLTGKVGVNNPGVLVSGISDCIFNIPTTKKMSSSYGANLDHYNFAWPNGTGTTSSYSASSAVENHVYDGNTSTISVTAYDARGQYKTVSKSITLISPSHASSITDTVRRNGIESITYLNGSISYWAGDWNNGSSRPNNLHAIEYRINKTGSYYNITSAVTSNSTVSTSNKIRTLTLNSNVIQLHANGSSGGFVVGTSYTVEIFVTTGVTNSGTKYNYDDRQKVAEITVTSGVFGMGRYKDSNGKYHYSINGLPSSLHTFIVNGDVHATTSFNNHVTRLTSCNITPESDKDYGGFRHDVATSSMTTGKPTVSSSDAHVLTMFWDNSGRYDAQMAIADTSAANTLKGVAFRGCDNGTWGSWKNLLDMIYPVGSIYISVNSTNPANLFGGGTWEEIKGRFLIGQDPSTSMDHKTLGAQIGKWDTDDTTLTEAQMPRHRHDSVHPRNNNDWHIGDNSGLGGLQSAQYILQMNYGKMIYNWSENSALWATSYTGGNVGHHHFSLPPSLVVKIWKRTA